MLNNETYIKIGILAVVIIIIICCIYCYTRDSSVKTSVPVLEPQIMQPMQSMQSIENDMSTPIGMDGQLNNEHYTSYQTGASNAGTEQSDSNVVNSCFPKSQLTPNELLPQNNDTVYANLNPTNTLKDQNFLQSGYHQGINTVGSGNKYNANMQLRSDPIIPMVLVSPWNIGSAARPDVMRKPLEVGQGPL